MSHNPGGPPPPYYGYSPPAPPPAPGAYAYVPTPVMMPMPVYQPPPVDPSFSQPTYVTNYIYQQPPAPPEPVHVVENPPLNPQAFIDWVPATPQTAATLSHRALVAGKEGWDGSPLWVIRAHHYGDFIPGKLAVKHRSAYIPHDGKEVPVHNFEFCMFFVILAVLVKLVCLIDQAYDYWTLDPIEDKKSNLTQIMFYQRTKVLCVPPHLVRWLPASNGQVPVGAIPAGNTHNGEPLYIGRARQMKSITPGKVHPSHGCLYISFGGSEIPHKSYEVLCKIVG